LTPTGLLMEGHYTQNAPAKGFERNRDFAPTITPRQFWAATMREADRTEVH
jgi:hypothetical protein